jgi:hypothetical protein
VKDAQSKFVLIILECLSFFRRNKVLANSHFLRLLTLSSLITFQNIPNKHHSYTILPSIIIESTIFESETHFCVICLIVSLSFLFLFWKFNIIDVLFIQLFLVFCLPRSPCAIKATISMTINELWLKCIISINNESFFVRAKTRWEILSSKTFSIFH